MILQAGWDEAAARRRQYVTPGGAVTYVSTYLGTNKMEMLAQGAQQDPAALAALPMAYLVEQAPHSVVDPHFHAIDQFQLFVGGSGRIGTHALEGITVHYAAAHSPYGPIAAGPEGVSYVTLRPGWDPGAQWMPGAAQVLRAMPDRRHVALTSEPLARCEDLRNLQRVAIAPVLPPDGSGFGASQVCAGPGAAVRIDPGGSRGLFCYVLAGALQGDGPQLGPAACIYFSGEEAPRALRAGAEGVELIQVAFGRS